MYTKLFVFFVVIGVISAAPTPGFLGGYAVPVATSYTNRVDIHSKPIVTYAAPVVTKALVAAPVAYEPLVSTYSVGHVDGGLGHGLGYGLDYGYGHGW